MVAMVVFIVFIVSMFFCLFRAEVETAGTVQSQVGALEVDFNSE